MKKRRLLVLNGEQITPIDGRLGLLWKTFGQEFSQLSKEIVYYGMAVSPYQDGLNSSVVENVMIVEIKTTTSFKNGYPRTQVTVIFSYTLRGE